MPKKIVNELGQTVVEVTWEEFQERMALRRAYTGKEDLNGKTLVVRHTWGLGDMLYMTPALKAIKEKFPKMKLIVICTFPDVLENNPYVDEVYHWNAFEDTLELSLKLEKEVWYYVSYDTPLKGGYDYKIHLRSKPQLNEYLQKLLMMDPAKLVGDERVFFEQASNAAVGRYKMVALDTYCYHLFVDPPDKSVHYFPYETELEFARTFLKPLKAKGHKIITLIPHTSTLYKDYPHWKEVIQLLPWNYFWLVLGSRPHPNESWRGTNVWDCINAFQFRKSAAIVIEADMCCSSDTGLLYTKAARGGKCVVTYGPHEPQPFLHYFPSAHGMRIEAIKEKKGMEGMCSVGCYIDTTSCHKQGTYSPCLEELSPGEVADEIQRYMEK